MLDKNTLKYGFLAGKLGAPATLTRPFLIGIRTLPIKHIAKYDDTFILLSNCNPYEAPIVFSGATHAYQKNSKLSPDINKDGVGDVASIQPGKYIMNDPGLMPYPIFVITLPDGNGNLPAWRDINHDGEFSPNELSIKTTANAILWHTGFDGPADSAHRSSIGCQTSNLKWLKKAREICQKMKVKSIDYCLINHDEAEKYFSEFENLIKSDNVV